MTKDPAVDYGPMFNVLLMPYFLEYVTGRSVGRAAIEAGSLHDALARADQVLKGMACVRAVLRYPSAHVASFGDGAALAGFTQSDGWRIHQPLQSGEAGKIACLRQN